MFSYTYLAYLAEENSPRLERPLNTECIMAKIFSCLHHDSDSLEGQARAPPLAEVCTVQDLFDLETLKVY